ncbi:phosphoethanolamine transferase [Oxalobacteraceae bacterium R-40]|uniref:Phosphoethanolamine transferase n=1 Tax=Keguizhuia sedimenti TaxID=3064264 RepID=A0ABU1BPL1_9BURK|nr:phosphoethanolamine transferase [Oxalobacteraceae bacterium R-40]
MEAVSWVAVWSVFKRPAWFHFLLLPAFLFLPVELYLQVYYGQGISTHHLGVLAETSPNEALEFLGNKVWLLAAALSAVVTWFFLTWRAALRARGLDWSDYSRWVALGLLLLGLATWTYGNHFGTHEPASHVVDAAAAQESGEEEEVVETDDTDVANAVAASADEEVLPKLPAWASIPADKTSFGSSWPFGLVTHAHDFWTERKYLAELSDKSRSFRFGARQDSAQDQPQVVVMVIGESSRFDRWSLNGYKRETNPLLKTETNLVSLSNVITAVSATRLSVPVLVSRKPATQSLKAGFSEKSFLTAFKEAGFKTFWLSNQMSFGQFDTPVSVFAEEAHVAQFLNLGGFTDRSNLDDVLLAPLHSAIADAAQKKLIVLHTLGNHWNYSHRYPKEFDRWQPSLFGVSHPAYTDLQIKTQLNNSYDNSILYTDWFLSQVIDGLKKSDQLTSLMYVADHGQTLYDGNCSLAFHGHNTQYEFHVPALVWYSDRYMAAYPHKVAQLVRRKHARLSTENVFHSLLDMADIRYTTEQLERSFFSTKFKPHKRYVDSYGWTDYDRASFKGDCREVIAKGKTLPQERH